MMILKQFSQLTRLTFASKPSFSKYVSQPNFLLSLVSSGIVIIGSAAGSLAQTATSNRPLPPPPLPKDVTPTAVETIPVTRQNTVSVPIEVQSTEETSSQPLREYTFEAPQTPPSVLRPQPSSTPQSITQPSQKPRFYRVEVVGHQNSLLSQVKRVEPMAFIRQTEGVIHAGMFPTSQQAEKRVQELQEKGVTANVVPVYRSGKQSLSVEIKSQ